MDAMIDDVRRLLLRDLTTVRLELLAYPDARMIWALPPGVPNSAGTLALHVAGNLRAYVGAVLGGSGYVRDRDREFAARDLPLSTLLDELADAERQVEAALSALAPARLAELWPEEVAGVRLPVGRFLLHLTVHLGYHLGQLDYHRRLVTGQGRGVGAVAVQVLQEDAEGCAGHTSMPVGPRASPLR